LVTFPYVYSLVCEIESVPGESVYVVIVTGVPDSRGRMEQSGPWVEKSPEKRLPCTAEEPNVSVRWELKRDDEEQPREATEP